MYVLQSNRCVAVARRRRIRALWPLVPRLYAELESHPIKRTLRLLARRVPASLVLHLGLAAGRRPCPAVQGLGCPPVYRPRRGRRLVLPLFDMA